MIEKAKIKVDNRKITVRDTHTLLLTQDRWSGQNYIKR